MLPLVSGRFFMLCTLMAFSHLVIAVSKLDLPSVCVDFSVLTYMGSNCV